jgi:hypothetical protein
MFPRGRAVRVQRVDDGGEAAVQIIVDAAELSAAVELVGGQAKAGQHGHENEAVPDLQLPANGFGDFHYSMQ